MKILYCFTGKTIETLCSLIQSWFIFRITRDDQQWFNECIVMEHMANGSLRDYLIRGQGSRWLQEDMLIALHSIRFVRFLVRLCSSAFVFRFNLFKSIIERGSLSTSIIYVQLKNL